MSINKPYKVSRNQLNIKLFRANAKDLMNSIKKMLGELSYDTDDPKYKYQGSGPNVKQVQFMISGEKAVDYYTKFIIQIEVTVDNAKVIKEGNKSVIEGDGKIIFLSKLLLDYDDKWTKDPFLHFLKGLHDKYLYRNTRKDFEVKVSREMFGIRDEVKRIVKMR